VIRQLNKNSTQFRFTVLVVSSVIIIPLSVHAGFFTGVFDKTVTPAKAAEVSLLVSPADVSLLSAQKNPDPLGGRGGAELLVDENALVSTGPIGEDEIALASNNSGEIRVYTVRSGDSLSMIAEMFNVTSNTIMWANDLTKATEIQPGDTLVILPIAGVRHIVKSGDTIDSIAKKYEGNVEEILSYNQLASAEGLAAGDTLIIPGGAMHSAPARTVASANPVKSSGGSSAGAALSHPAPGSVKSQGIHGYNAIDLAGSNGSAIRAAAAGEVIVAKTSGWNGGYGSYVVIKHANGVQTLYAHLSSLNIGVGSYVEQGQTIGGMGNTGRSTGTHLHFEVRGARNPF
jgi:murein DD-endopeptidase MepM/ murein hydrolase activator NlpD